MIMNTNEIIALMKEKEGLKLKYHNYKRKYHAINRVLHRLYYKIVGLKEEYVVIAQRILREDISKEDKALMSKMLSYISKERQELQVIYDMCIEVSK